MMTDIMTFIMWRIGAVLLVIPTVKAVGTVADWRGILLKMPLAQWRIGEESY